MSESPALVLRAATPDDAEEVALLWHGAWSDGHAGHVPQALYRFRTLDHFRSRVPPRIAQTTVALQDRALVGFVTVHHDEVEQVFVNAQARGRGAAAALLAHAEQVIAARAPVAWLAVVAGNARARRFYEKRGWRDVGEFDYAAETPEGPIPVPCRRYEKRLLGG